MENYKLATNVQERQVVFRPEINGQIKLVSGSRKHVFTNCNGPHEVVRVGSWLAEMCRGTIGLRYLPGSSGNGDLKIVFEPAGGTAAADLRMVFVESGNNEKELARKKVKQILLTRDSLTLMTDGEEAEAVVEYPRETSSTNTNPPATDTTPVNRTPATIVNPDAERAYAEKEKKLKGRIVELERELQKMRTENNALRASSAIAEQIGTEQQGLATLTDQTQKLNVRLQEIRRETTQKSTELTELQGEVESAQREAADLEKRSSDAQAELKKLTEERERLRSRSEVLEIDVEKTNEEISGLRERLKDDRLTVSAMEEDSAIGTGSVKDSLDKAESNLKKAEKKIEIIIKLRETINRQVQDSTIGRASEFLTAGEETGGQ